MTTELLPCPFCGGTDSDENACQMAKVVTRQFKSAIGVRAFRVECACGAQGPAKLDWLDAESAWSARAAIQSQTSPDVSPASYCALCDLEHALHEDAQGFHHVIKGERATCHQSAPQCTSSLPSGESDPSVMLDYGGADTTIRPQCAPDREALVRAIQLSYARKDLEPTSATTLALYREDAENAADAVLALTRPECPPTETKGE